MTKKPVEKLKHPLWYKAEPALNYLKAYAEKGKPVAYFKIAAGRYGGRRQMEVFCKVFESGLSIYVNLTMMKIGTSTSISTPFQMRASDRHEFNKAMKIFLTAIK